MNLFDEVSFFLYNLDPYNTGCKENELYDEYDGEAAAISEGEPTRDVFLGRFGFLPENIDYIERTIDILKSQ